MLGDGAVGGDVGAVAIVDVAVVRSAGEDVQGVTAVSGADGGVAAIVYVVGSAVVIEGAGGGAAVSASVVGPLVGDAIVGKAPVVGSAALAVVVIIVSVDVDRRVVDAIRLEAAV